MKKKNSLMPLFGMIVFIGLVSTILNSDYEIGAYLEDLAANNLELLLNYLNIGLAFLALGSIFIVLIVRAAKNDKEYFWDFNTDDFREDN